MTCREMLALEYPEWVGDQFESGCYCCPMTYGYAGKPGYCSGPGNESLCKCCWDREVEDIHLNPGWNGKEKDWDMDWENEEDDSNEEESTIKSNGEMTVFASGAVRDKKTGKGRCDLLPACVLLRLARHYERGAERFGPYNWKQGIPCHSFVDSALRHMLKYMDGWTDEDHLIAAIWNLCGLAWTEEKLPELMDIPERAVKQSV